jgi:hypothetical protein
VCTVPNRKPQARRNAPRRTRFGQRSDSLRRLQDADARLAAQLAPSSLAVLADDAEQAVFAITAPARARTKRSAITGEVHPAPAQIARIRRQNLYHGFRERQELLRDALSVPEVAELLGVGRQTPHDRLRANRLLAIRENGRLLFPDWQFDPDGPDGALPGLAEVLAALDGPISPLGRIRWFVTPSALFGGRSPQEELHAGRAEDVILEAASVGVS